MKVRYDVGQALLVDIVDTFSRYKRLVIEIDPIYGLVLRSTDSAVLAEGEKKQGRRPAAW
jgi:DNA excision repair protein ERCC-3